ncbi:MAG: DUF2273 domain-containing protein [SAR202 cluster bacterium]|nr:DUF2273 domain-containing protein [SAR202 cluster bacterium]
MNNPKITGLVFGLILGVVLVWLGWWEAIVVGVLALTGWLIGKYVAGEFGMVDGVLERFVETRRNNGGR